MKDAIGLQALSTTAIVDGLATPGEVGVVGAAWQAGKISESMIDSFARTFRADPAGSRAYLAARPADYLAARWSGTSRLAG